MRTHIHTLMRTHMHTHMSVTICNSMYMISIMYMCRIKVKLGDKIGIIPDNFIEIIKKEAPKLPTPPLPSREEPPPLSRPPPPEKKEEVCAFIIMHM